MVVGVAEVFAVGQEERMPMRNFRLRRIEVGDLHFTARWPLSVYADAAREEAAWWVSEALGWRIVPPTIVRDGPAGPGAVERDRRCLGALAEPVSAAERRIASRRFIREPPSDRMDGLAARDRAGVEEEAGHGFAGQRQPIDDRLAGPQDRLVLVGRIASVIITALGAIAAFFAALSGVDPAPCSAVWTCRSPGCSAAGRPLAQSATARPTRSWREATRIERGRRL